MSFKLVVGFYLIFAAQVTQASEPIRLEPTAATLNTFSSFSAYLNYMHEFGVLTKEQAAVIQHSIASQKIPDNFLLKCTAKTESEISCGTATLTSLPNGAFKVSNGTVVKVDVGESADRVYEKLLNAYRSRLGAVRGPIETLLKATVPTAGAAVHSVNRDETLAAVLGSAAAAMSTALGMGFTAACGGPLLLDSFIQKFREWSVKKDYGIHCENGRYVYNEFDSDRKLIINDVERIKAAQKRDVENAASAFKSGDSRVLQAAVIICALPIGHLVGAVSRHTALDPGVVMATFKGESPPCTQGNLPKVSAYIDRTFASAVDDFKKQGRTLSEISIGAPSAKKLN